MNGRRTIVFLLTLALMFMMGHAVNAEQYTAKYDSPAAIAGNTSNHDSIRYLSYGSQLSAVYGGDVGIWFYATSVGLQDSFVQSTGRTSEIYPFEIDGSSSLTWRYYTGHFGMNSDLNQIQYYTFSEVAAVLVENDGTMELQLRFFVDSVAGDTSYAVPAGLFQYRFWSY